MNKPTAAGGRPRTGVGHYLRDVVYGASDGVVTTLAVVAGSAGANFALRVAVVLGLANLVADGLSMGASNYLGLKSELEQTGRSVADEQPWRHGLATVGAFVVAGAIPLLAYALSSGPSSVRFPLACLLSMVTLAVVGGGRARFTQKPTGRCALEMIVVAGAASASAFGLGYAARLLL